LHKTSNKAVAGRKITQTNNSSNQQSSADGIIARVSQRRYSGTRN